MKSHAGRDHLLRLLLLIINGDQLRHTRCFKYRHLNDSIGKGPIIRLNICLISTVNNRGNPLPISAILLPA